MTAAQNYGAYYQLWTETLTKLVEVGDDVEVVEVVVFVVVVVVVGEVVVVVLVVVEVVVAVPGTHSEMVIDKRVQVVPENGYLR